MRWYTAVSLVLSSKKKVFLKNFLLIYQPQVKQFLSNKPFVLALISQLSCKNNLKTTGRI